MGKKAGAHEEAAEKARDLLNKGMGMGEIKEKTSLSEKDIVKVKDKMKRR